MLTEALAALAASGGTALVAAAATDAWQYARTGFARLFAHGQRRHELVESRLDQTATEVNALPSLTWCANSYCPIGRSGCRICWRNVRNWLRIFVN
jgi:hypothetical protein